MDIETDITDFNIVGEKYNIDKVSNIYELCLKCTQYNFYKASNIYELCLKYAQSNFQNTDIDKNDQKHMSKICNKYCYIIYNISKNPEFVSYYTIKYRRKNII